MHGIRLHTAQHDVSVSQHDSIESIGIRTSCWACYFIHDWISLLLAGEGAEVELMKLWRC